MRRKTLVLALTSAFLACACNDSPPNPGDLFDVLGVDAGGGEDGALELGNPDGRDQADAGGFDAANDAIEDAIVQDRQADVAVADGGPEVGLEDSSADLLGDFARDAEGDLPVDAGSDSPDVVDVSVDAADVLDLSDTTDLIHLDSAGGDDADLSVDLPPDPFERTCGLLTNGSAETGDMTGWSIAEGEFRAVAESSSLPAAYEGTYSFFAGTAGASEAFQEIDVSEWREHLDEDGLYLTFSGHVRDWSGRDDAYLIVEALNGSGDVLDTVEEGPFSDEAWQPVTAELLLPVGTEVVYVAIRGERNAGSDNDAYFDALDVCLDREPLPADPMDLLSPPYLMWVTQDGVSVRWETSDAVVGRVFYGADSALGSVAEEDAAVTTHEIRLSGLSPSTDYYYSIEVGERTLPVKSFRTAPADDDKSPFTFVVWGDNQNRPNNFSRHIPNMIAREPAFALSVGDNVQNGTRDEYRSQLFRPLTPLADHVPYLVANGNHEYYSSPGISLFREYVSLPGDEHCFGWRYGEVFFLFLDSEQDLGDGTAVAACVDAELTSSAATSATYQVALYHQPPRVEYWAGGLITYPFAHNPLVLDWLEPKLVALNVDVVFNGHNHLYLHALTDTGLNYFTTGGGGGDIDEAGIGSRVKFGGWDEIKTQIHEHHFMSVTVDDGTMVVTAINIDGNVIHTTTLER